MEFFSHAGFGRLIVKPPLPPLASTTLNVTGAVPWFVKHPLHGLLVVRRGDKIETTRLEKAGRRAGRTSHFVDIATHSASQVAVITHITRHECQFTSHFPTAIIVSESEKTL